MLPKFLKPSTRGAALAEYGLIAGLIAVVAIGAVSRGGEEVEGAFTTAGLAVKSVVNGGSDVVPVEDEADACTAEPGALCRDGTVHVGTWGTDLALYTTRCDAGMSWDGAACVGTRSSFFWNNGSTTGHVTTGATDDSDGAANTARIVGMDADSLTEGMQPHQAAEYCANLTAHGYSDWFLPANSQANSLRINTLAIGGFVDHATDSLYWSSTETNDRQARIRRMSDGSQFGSWKHMPRHVRCVRAG